MKLIKTYLPAVVLFTALIIPGCRHGLKPVVYRVSESGRTDLSSGETYFMQGYILGRKNATNPIEPGEGTVLISNQSMVNPKQEEINTGLILSVGEINYRFYFSLPQQIKKDSIAIGGESLCRIIGMYELPDSVRNFECQDGFIRIDTVKSSRISAVFSGTYQNSLADTLIFEGSIGAKKK